MYKSKSSSALLHRLARLGGASPPTWHKRSILSSSTSLVHSNASKISDNDTITEGDRPFSNRSRILLLSFGLGTLTSLAYWKTSKNDSISLLKSAHCTSEDNSNNTSRSKQFNFIAEAVEMAAPAVVNIENTQMVNTIFGRLAKPSCGSGFIVDESGHVLTNAHVVHSATNVMVKMSNGRSIKGTVKFIDESTDLALIKMELKRGETVPYLPFGESAKLRSGEWVIAMGSPLALSNTITAGIVSCVHRTSSDLGQQDKADGMEYVQTDAMITKGNSGGPLVNLDGEVIGINTMTAGPGISFAIPSDIAKAFLEATKRDRFSRKEKKYGIGVSLLTINSNLLYHLQAQRTLPPEVTNGVLLVEVWQGSPADDAGLVRGDVIVKINGHSVESSKQVQMMVHKGQRMEFEVIHHGRRRVVTVIPTPLGG